MNSLWNEYKLRLRVSYCVTMFDFSPWQPSLQYRDFLHVLYKKLVSFSLPRSATGFEYDRIRDLFYFLSSFTARSFFLKVVSVIFSSVGRQRSATLGIHKREQFLAGWEKWLRLHIKKLHVVLVTESSEEQFIVSKF